eukprot:TRINITY_DN7319_c0_g1_i1.p1 TRINITY_DN7319_c0_g1~~TRINITY_DN7319_c0_g1_i1.p1  ORF type:complete len:740 (-),score=233.71 TRINITY_DN7319_c0_g1_i1:152-2371(-)
MGSQEERFWREDCLLKEQALAEREKILDGKEKELQELAKVFEEREKLMVEREKVAEAKEQLNKERERSFEERGRIIRERERKIEERIAVVREKEKSSEEKEKAVSERETSVSQREKAAEETERRLKQKEKELQDQETLLEKKEKIPEAPQESSPQPEEKPIDESTTQNLSLPLSSVQQTQEILPGSPKVLPGSPKRKDSSLRAEAATGEAAESEIKYFKFDPLKYESVPLSVLLNDPSQLLSSPRMPRNELNASAAAKTVLDRPILLFSALELNELLKHQKSLPVEHNKKGFVVFDFYRTQEGERIWYREHIWGALWMNTDSPNCSSYLRKDIQNGLFDFVLVADGWRNQNAIKAAKELALQYKESTIAILKDSYEEFAHKYPEYIWKRIDHMKYLHLQHQLASPAAQILPFLWLGSDRDVPEFMGQNDWLLRIRNSDERSAEMRLDIEFTYEKFENFHHQPDRCLYLDLPSPDTIDEAIDFIVQAEASQGRILVHCPAGMFSSPAVVIGYLIKIHKMTYKQAFQFVEEKKTYIFLFHFEWDKTLKGLHEKLVQEQKEKNNEEFLVRAKDEGNVLNLDFSGYLPSKIIDGLFLGGVCHAVPPVLDKFGITHVLTVADDVEVTLPERYSHKVFKLNDFGESDLSVVLDECCDFIESGISSGNAVLVHCKLGVNRSVSCLLSYLIRNQKMGLRDALFFVRGRRPLLNPVHSYVEQLIKYELKVHKKTSFNISEYDDFLGKW